MIHYKDLSWDEKDAHDLLQSMKKGDKIQSATSKKHLLISDLFINNKLSKYNKLTQPLVVDKLDRIIWVPGLSHGNIKELSKHTNSKIIEWVQI